MTVGANHGFDIGALFTAIGQRIEKLERSIVNGLPNLEQLPNVAGKSLADGQVLVWDFANQKWKPGSGGGALSSPLLVMIATNGPMNGSGAGSLTPINNGPLLFGLGNNLPGATSVPAAVIAGSLGAVELQAIFSTGTLTATKVSLTVTDQTGANRITGQWAGTSALVTGTPFTPALTISGSATGTDLSISGGVIVSAAGGVYSAYVSAALTASGVT